MGRPEIVRDKEIPSGANDGLTRRPPQEARCREDIEDLAAIINSKVKQARGLRERKLEAGHLDELRAYSVDQFCDLHIPQQSNGRAMWCASEATVVILLNRWQLHGDVHADRLCKNTTFL